MKKFISCFVSLALIIGIMPISFAKEEKPWYSYAIIALGDKGFEIDKNPKIVGDVYSVGDIEFGKNGEVDGNVYTKGIIDADKHLKVKGKVYEKYNIPTISIEDMVLGNKDKPIPGVETSKGSTKIDKNVKVKEFINLSSVKVDIGKNVVLDGGLYAPDAEIDIDKNAVVNGVIYAPNGKIKIGDNAVINGSIIAQEIEIGDNAKINYKYCSDIIKPKGKDEVKIKVSDSIGEKLSFNNLENGNDYILDKAITLKGESRAQFLIDSENYDKFQYNIVKSLNPPIIKNISEWNELNKDKIKYIDDVMLDKKGNLKHQAYNVTHLDSVNDGSGTDKEDKRPLIEKWNDPKTVYKNPYSTLSIVSAKKASTIDQYGKKGDYRGADGKPYYKWINNTIFLRNMSIDSKYKDYKEASKIWGYFTVPEDGEYNFRSYSDDGLWAYIIVDDIEIPIVNKDIMFKLHGRNGIKYNINGSYKYGYEYGLDYKFKSSSGNSYEYTVTGESKSVKLEKGKFYPIYMEYFNWGGSACFEMQYKLKNESAYKQIPSENFYPSKSNSPIEYAESNFKGVEGMTFPNKSGNYYVVYKASSSKDSKTLEGVVGPFSIESRASFNIKRNIYSFSGEKLQKDSNGVYNINNEKFKINYEIRPKNIPKEDMVGSSITISNAIVKTKIPNGLVFNDKSENNVINNINGIEESENSIPISTIEYYFDKEENVYKPKIGVVSYTHTILAKDSGEYVLSEGDTILGYKESDGADIQYTFSEEKINIKLETGTDIIKSGLYDVSSGSFKAAQRVPYLIPVTLAVDINVKTKNPFIKFETNAVKGDDIILEKHEIDKNNNIIPNSGQTIKLKGNMFKVTNNSDKAFNLDFDKRYRLIYKLRPSDKDIFNVNVESDSGKKTNFKVDVFSLPIIK